MADVRGEEVEEVDWEAEVEELEEVQHLLLELYVEAFAELEEQEEEGWEQEAQEEQIELDVEEGD